MRLDASCEMSLTADSPTPLVAMLRPRSGVGQWVVSEAYEIEPFVPVVEYVDGYGNLCQRLTAPKGSFRIRVEATIETADTIAVERGAPFTSISELPDDVLQFLLPSRYCPSDKTEDAAREFASSAKPGYDQAEAIRKHIHERFEYKYGVSSASSDALDTLKVKKGVCRDFSHVGISLCRSLRIPARMVVGYLYKLDPMDLHAWFEAFVGGRWYTFDATQPEPRGGRVAVAYGRDAADVAIFTEYGPVEMKNMKVRVDEVRKQ
ncbi:MAG TPA: transglutaminase family protein [Polyangiales bacterium]|jgi:transglutaminase-like putative cysteine protease|nr:transglutaminase family protein [Polyangiales bacterium]